MTPSNPSYHGISVCTTRCRRRSHRFVYPSPELLQMKLSVRVKGNERVTRNVHQNTVPPLVENLDERVGMWEILNNDHDTLMRWL